MTTSAAAGMSMVASPVCRILTNSGLGNAVMDIVWQLFSFHPPFSIFWEKCVQALD